VIDATLYLKRKDGVSADEAKISSRVQYVREDGVVGPLAARRVVESDWSGVRQAVLVNFFPVGAVWRYPSGTAAAIPAGADFIGTRRDIARDCGSAVDPVDGIVTGPAGLDG
jgi:hypothetical protein